MRKHGLIILAVLFAIAGTIAYFIQDSKIERMLEDTAEHIAGARVEIDNFHLSLLTLNCSWDRLQVANRRKPWRNILETDRASIAIEFRPLFWKKIVIREIVLENVRSSSPRSRDGRLTGHEKEKAEFVNNVTTSLKNQFSEIPIFNPSSLADTFKVESLIKIDSLVTILKYRQLYTKIDSSALYWQKNIQPEPYLSRIDSIQKKIEALPIDKIDRLNLIELTTTLKSIQSIRKEISTIKNDVNNQYNSFETSFKSIEAELKAAP